MSAANNEWYVTTVSDSPSLRMLLLDVREHVRRARLCQRLDANAQVFAVTEPDCVRLWVNAAAMACLDVFRRVPLHPAEGPAERERVNSLVSWGSRATGQQRAVP